MKTSWTDRCNGTSANSPPTIEYNWKIQSQPIVSTGYIIIYNVGGHVLSVIHRFMRYSSTCIFLRFISNPCCVRDC